jgi:hypothetical protein
VIPSNIWKKLADHPDKSRRARLGPETRAWTSFLPHASTGSSIKAGDLFGISSGLPARRKDVDSQPAQENSFVASKRPDGPLIPATKTASLAAPQSGCSTLSARPA